MTNLPFVVVLGGLVLIGFLSIIAPQLGAIEMLGMVICHSEFLLAALIGGMLYVDVFNRWGYSGLAVGVIVPMMLSMGAWVVIFGIPISSPDPQPRFWEPGFSYHWEYFGVVAITIVEMNIGKLIAHFVWDPQQTPETKAV
jgi:hypothetical protein